MRSKVLRFGFISSYVPKKCGIATFSRDLINGILSENGRVELPIVAAEDPGESYNYGEEVISVLKTNQKNTYLEAARAFNKLDLDGVLLQHEFGLYGGDWTKFTKDGIKHNDPVGNYIFNLIDKLKMPVFTTLHTVLPQPDNVRKQVIQQLSDRSSALITMTNDSKNILETKYNIPSNKVFVIPHGVPEAVTRPRESTLNKLNLDPKNFYLVITGLISPNKGIDLVIKSLPKILDKHPNVRLLVVGETHPHILAHEGEKYRDKLMKLAKKLSVQSSVTFINKYIPTDTLMQYLSASDIYMTIHRDAEQSASGTLAYAVGTGLLTISTPYRYAQELLNNGRGFIVPFESPKSITDTVNKLIGDSALRARTKQKLRLYGRNMEWPVVGKSYLRLIENYIKQQNRQQDTIYENPVFR